MSALEVHKVFARGGPGGKSIAVVMVAFALVVAAGPRVAAAQALGGDAREQALLARVQEIMSRDGPYSRDLLEPFTDLGLLYVESDDEILALTALERALHIVRVNDGLSSLHQVPLVRQLIRLERAIGDNVAAWDREQGLLRLIRRHPHDLSAVPVLREVADRQMAVLKSVLAGKRPPEVALGCFYEQWPSQRDASCSAGSRSTVVQGMLAEAQRNYAAAIGILLEHGMHGSREAQDLELALLRGVDLLREEYYEDPRARPVPLAPAYVGSSSLEPWRGRLAPIIDLRRWELSHSTGVDADEHSRNRFAWQRSLMQPYYRGRESLRRLYLYRASSEAPYVRQADAVVQLADWELLHSRNAEAMDGYAEAYEMLERAAASPTSVEQLFAPPTPVVLPAFQPSPLENGDPASAKGHIDVALEITKYGRSRAIEILDSENATPDEQDDLVSLLKRQRYRPRLSEGVIAAAAPVVFRYYLHD